MLGGPRGLAFDASGNLYIADFLNGRVRKVFTDTDGVVKIVTIAGGGTETTDGSHANETLLLPFGVAVDASGNLYIADFITRCDRVVAPPLNGTGIIMTVAGNRSSAYTGPLPPVGDGGLATTANLSLPRTLAFDAAGSFCLPDTEHARVRMVAHPLPPGTGTIITVAGTGLAGFSGDGGPATETQLLNPFGVALDPAGNLYISEFGNRVRRLNVAAKLHVCPDEADATRVTARIEFFAPGHISIGPPATTDVNLSTLTLQTIDPILFDPTSPPSAAVAGSAVIGDDDGNGVPDLTVSFPAPPASSFPTIFRVTG